MFLSKLLILLALCGYSYTGRWQHYNKYIYKEYDHRQTYHRIVELMRSYYEEATSRITYLNPIRFMYEESPYYEMGYITGEIIERYRKVVEYAQKSVRFKFYTFYDILKNVELVQKLYFELYHLVRMIHETPRKFRNDTEFVNMEKIAGPGLLGGKGIDGKGTKFVVLTQKELSDMFALEQRLMEQERNRLKEKKRQKKKFDKVRQAFLQGLLTDMKPKKKPYNTKWPIDYGWEIQGEW